MDLTGCPERVKRAAMTDAEFWDYVLLGVEPGEDSDQPDPPETWEDVPEGVAPCLECGAIGPCAFDPEGRPLIHQIET
jgi:hypothetical protein